jgi:hypothetical protein
MVARVRKEAAGSECVGLEGFKVAVSKRKSASSRHHGIPASTHRFNETRKGFSLVTVVKSGLPTKGMPVQQRPF